MPIPITGLPAQVVPGDNDPLAIVDSAGAITKKITRANLLKGAPLPANTVNAQAIANASITPSKLATGALTQTVPGVETTNSTTYTSLATNLSVSATIGANGLALVSVTGKLYNNLSGQEAWMSFAISGATTVAATDGRGINVLATGANVPQVTCSGVFLVTGLTPGTNVFTAQHRATSGTAGFQYRNISVVPL